MWFRRRTLAPRSWFLQPDQEHEEELTAAQGRAHRQQPCRAHLPPNGPAANLRRLPGDRELSPQARGVPF